MNHMHNKLTVMVSLYNSGEWIENRLNNLLESTMKTKITIWCINANSPDERDDLIPRKFPVSYIKLDKKVNVYTAWNIIIKNSHSEYITNANADDIVAPDAYEKLISKLEHIRGRPYDFVYPSWYVTNQANQKWPPTISVDSRGGQPGRYGGDLNKGGVGHFPLWKRSLHDRFGLFDERFNALGDADWWARCYFIGKVQFLWCDKLLASYLYRNGQNLWHREINTNEWDLYHSNVEKYKQGML